MATTTTTTTTCDDDRSGCHQQWLIWMEEAGVDADLRPDMMILKTSGSEVTRHTFASVSDHSTRRGARRARTIAHTQNPPPGAKTTTKRICNKQQAENLCASLCAAARLAPNPHGLAVREVSVALSRSLLRLLALSLCLCHPAAVAVAASCPHLSVCMGRRRLRLARYSDSLSWSNC